MREELRLSAPVATPLSLCKNQRVTRSARGQKIVFSTSHCRVKWKDWWIS